MSYPYRPNKYQWVYDARWTVEQLEEHYKNATDSTLKQVIRKRINERTRPIEKKNENLKWSQTHNWALFSVMGAQRISTTMWNLSYLLRDNTVAQQFQAEYNRAMCAMMEAEKQLKEAEGILRLITAQKKEKDAGNNNRVSRS